MRKAGIMAMCGSATKLTVTKKIAKLFQVLI
jgi:hypothetical protein